MSHKFSHSAPCVGFSFLTAQMGAFPDKSLREAAAIRPGERLQETTSQPRKDPKLFLLGECHIVPALSATVLLPCSGQVM